MALVLGFGCRPPDVKEAVAPYPSLVGREAPALHGAFTWFNGPGMKLEALRGKVVLLQFFDYSCVNCIRTYPYLTEWYRRYAPLGLEVVGVHSPQFGFSSDPVNVLASVRQYNLTYPIAIDSDLTIAQAYTNRFWPRMLLVDQAGKVRFDHTGEGAYLEAERMIQTLLREGEPTVKLPALMSPLRDVDRPGVVCYPTTPELYLGRLRGQLANVERAATNAVILFSWPEPRVEGKVFANGEWSIYDEYMRHAVDKDHLEDGLMLKYRATELNVVMKAEGNYWMQVFVEIDGKPIRRDAAGIDVSYDEEGRSFVRVDVPRMYNVTVKQPYGMYEARLRVRGKGLSVFSFSFGTCAIPRDADTLRPAKTS